MVQDTNMNGVNNNTDTQPANTSTNTNVQTAEGVQTSEGNSQVNSQVGVNNNTNNVNNGSQTNKSNSGLASQAGNEANEGNEGEPKEGAPQAYDFKPLFGEGDFDEGTANALGDVCRELNLNQEQANKIAQLGIDYHDNIINAAVNEQEKIVNGWAEETKEKLGSKFNETMGNYGKALHYLERTSPNIRQILNDTGAGNRIEVVQAMALLGSLLSEDKGVGANAGGSNASSNLYPNTDWSRYRNG